MYALSLHDALPIWPRSTRTRWSGPRRRRCGSTAARRCCKSRSCCRQLRCSRGTEASLLADCCLAGSDWCLPLPPGSCTNGCRLVELVRDHGILDEQIEGDDLQRCLVRGFQHNSAGGSGFLHLQPAGGADAPAIAGFEALESVLRLRGGEVVAQRLRCRKKGLVNDTADGVYTEVVGAGFATSAAIEAGHGEIGRASCRESV